MKISVDLIAPNPQQPRQVFDTDDLRGLAESIREHGLLNPIAVEGPVDGRYYLIDGERRWRAHKMLGLEEIEASVREPDHADRLVLALIGNLQRRDLNALERARAFQQLREEGLTMERMAAQLGVSMATIAAGFLLLEMDAPIQQLVADGRISSDPKMLYALRDIPDAEQRVRLATIAAEKKQGAAWVRAWSKRMGGERQKTGSHRLPQAYERAAAAGGHWNAIAQVGRRPEDARLAQAADAVCRDCPLYDEADERTCRACPLVDLLRRFG